MNSEWIGKTINNPIKKIENSKHQIEIATCVQKLPRKRFLVKTPFSHSTFKLERTKFTPQTTRFFAPLPVSAWPKSLLQFDFKINENIWTDLKKNLAGTIPETTPIGGFWIPETI